MNNVKVIGADPSFHFPDNVSTCEGCGTRGECIIIDDVHYKVWTPLPPDVLAKFIRGRANEVEQPLNEYEKQLLEWLEVPVKTIRYMSRQELEDLRKTIIDTLLAYGGTQKRAEELTVYLVNIDESEKAEISFCEQTKDAAKLKAVPFIDKDGNLVIPINCDPRYHWWNRGQSISQTLEELVGRLTPNPASL